MNRIVLAILALFAGIAAQVSPAEARVCGRVEVGAVQAHRVIARAVVAVQAAAPFRAAARIPDQDWLATTPVAFAAIKIAAVRLGPDRARE